MCSLCGMLGDGGHWSDPSQSPGTFPARTRTHTRSRERQERTRQLNRILAHYGLSVSDWQGNAFLLRTHTGQTVLVDHLSALWEAAAKLLKRPCDPLDPSLLESLSRS